MLRPPVSRLARAVALNLQRDGRLLGTYDRPSLGNPSKSLDAQTVPAERSNRLALVAQRSASRLHFRGQNHCTYKFPAEPKRIAKSRCHFDSEPKCDREVVWNSDSNI